MRGISSGAMPMPVSRMHSVFGSARYILTLPSRVYLSEFESTCSTTKASHFSSLTTLAPDGSSSRLSRFEINSPANFFTARRINGSSSNSRMT